MLIYKIIILDIIFLKGFENTIYIGAILQLFFKYPANQLNSNGSINY